MIRRIGCRAHDYGKDTIENLMAKIAGDGYQTTQLALKKALADVDDLTQKLNLDYAKKIQSAMSAKNVDVSVFGAYLNYAHPDEQVRQENLRILEGHISIAKKLGARMVGTETGSLDPGYKAHVDNHDEVAYERFRDAIKSVMPLVHEKDTWMAVEAVSHHIIHTPERMNRLVRDIEDDRLKVIFDISNIMTEDNWQDQAAIIKEMFDLLGDKIVVIHVKDFDFVDGEKVILPIGQGKLNFEALMDAAIASEVAIDVLAENIPQSHLKETVDILKNYINQ